MMQATLVAMILNNAVELVIYVDLIVVPFLKKKFIMGALSSFKNVDNWGDVFKILLTEKLTLFYKRWA